MHEIRVRDPVAQQPGVPFIADLPGQPTATMFDTVFDQCPDCIEMIRLDGKLSYSNANGRGSLERDIAVHPAGADWLDLWPAGERERLTEALAEVRGGQSARLSLPAPAAGGVVRWWDVTLSPVLDDDGKVQSFVSISRDVTASTTAKEALEAMSLELRHRLRNAYSVGAAIANLAARESPAHKEFAETLSGRFQALSVMQTRFLGADGGIRLDEFISDLRDAFSPGPETFVLEHVPAVLLDEAHARVVSVVFGELGTNSLKYGALSSGGTITIAGQADEHALTLTWRELTAGPHPLPAQSRREGTGYGLMGRMAATCGGTIVQQWDESTLTVTLSLPLPCAS